jgi:GMP synthase-like glutamine amidotransferase
MAKSLLVNCSLKSANEALIGAVGKFSEYTVIEFKNVNEDYRFNKDIDAVIIGGSAARIVNPSDRAKFEGVVKLIRSCDLPIFSICYGHQLLCWTFGAQAGTLAQPVLDRFEKVRVIDNDQIFSVFAERDTISVSESHYDYVLKQSLNQAGMVLLADSDSCEVEAVKHKSQPFYGVQFHPERISVKGETHPEGHEILENFYKNVVKK